MTGADRLPVLLDVEGVAAHLNITVRHVRRLVFERRIPHLKVGNLLRFDPEEIAIWVHSLAVCRPSIEATAIEIRSLPGRVPAKPVTPFGLGNHRAHGADTGRRHRPARDGAT